jgi:hypothetical protein
VSFSKGDNIEFRISIFSPIGIIEPSSIKLNQLKEVNIQKQFMHYEKSLIKNNLIFDKTRSCELENLVHVWKNESNLSKKTNINEFKLFFSEYFKILDISYDFFKYYIFKVKMQAKKQGTIRRNKYTNFDIHIKGQNEVITNETQCLGLLNITHLSDKVELRLSTYVMFYFTDIYI